MTRVSQKILTTSGLEVILSDPYHNTTCLKVDEGSTKRLRISENFIKENTGIEGAIGSLIL